jgi:predicted acyl esterase
MRHPNRDDYWRHGSVCEDYSQIKAAVLAIGGWHDGYRNTPANLLDGLLSPVKAIMGPWNHKYPHLGMPEPKIDFVTEALRWWDHWLKGKDTGVADDPAYRAYVMDSIGPAKSYGTRPGRWIALNGLSAPEIDQWCLHLAGENLSEAAAETHRTVDTNTRCGEGSGQYFPFGFGPGELPDDQRDDDARSMSFDTDPLGTRTELVGAPKLNLRVGATTSRAQLAVRLSDVHPDGAATLISHGFLNLRHRNSFEFPEDLVDGETYDVTVQLDHCAYSVPAGHRLRIAISPSYWPFIWPEAEATHLTITNGTLALPVLASDAPKYTVFPPVQPAPPNPVVQKTTGPEAQEWRCENGTRTLLIEADHGLSIDETHGLETTSAMREQWQIDDDDPASARCTIEWTRGMGRGDWQVKTHCIMTLRGDASQFFVTGELRAFEDETEVFVRSFNETVPR